MRANQCEIEPQSRLAQFVFLFYFNVQVQVPTAELPGQLHNAEHTGPCTTPDKPKSQMGGAC